MTGGRGGHGSEPPRRGQALANPAPPAALPPGGRTALSPDFR